ncbi:MAG: CoA-acylating methylmalonate-semialdehyde dehydrogenase [Desulfohalobiaceae bacterium]
MALPIMKNYINGEWELSASTEIGKVRCPATGDQIAEVPYSTAAEVDQAVSAASEAFEEWRRVPPLTRARYMFALKEVFEENFEDISKTLVREMGKTMDESRGEVRRMIENVEHSTGVTSLMKGSTLEDIAKGIDCSSEPQPMGVFGCIPPFNFPAMVPWWFMPYALVTGNTYVLKPSEQVPMTQSLIFELMEEIDLPEGVVNMVHGSQEAVNAMLDHPEIQGMSFVGSTPTAKYIYKRCGETGKRVQSLGGAKNIVTVMPDTDIDKALPSLITSFYGCAGQRCLSGAVLAPVGDVADELLEKFVDQASSLKLGDGLDPSTQMGPVVSAEHKERVHGYIDKGVEEGADLVLDGRNPSVDNPNGFFVGPTVFDNVHQDMTIAKEEIFGPVVSVLRAESLQETIDFANSRGMANAACIYTSSGAAAREFKYKVKPSMVGVNIGIAAPMSFFPFGGSGESMFGTHKGQGQDAFHFFTDAKVVINRWF